MRTMLRHKHQFILSNGLLYKKVIFGSQDKPSLQFVLPKVIKACHDDIGHLGLEISLDLLKDRFLWPRMNEEMRNHV